MEFREYRVVLRRRWWVVALTAMVAVAAAYILARTQSPVYRSSVRLEVTGRIDYGQVLAIDKLLRQTAARVKTTAVAEAVDQRLRLGLGPDALLGKIHAQAYSDVLHIQVDIDDVIPERAERIAASVAEVVQERQLALMASVPQQERIGLALLDRPAPGQLIWPQTRQMMTAAGILGLVAGVLLAFVAEYLDDTIKTPDEVKRYLGLDVLGGFPLSPTNSPSWTRGGQLLEFVGWRRRPRLNVDR